MQHQLPLVESILIKITPIKKDIRIEAADGFPLAATLFAPRDQPNGKAIVLGSALGVPRYIYFKLAQFLKKQGFIVLTFDYRGVHESQNSQVSGAAIKMADWGALDIDATLAWMINEYQAKELIYLGHSCGGQLLGMAPHATEISKAIFVASQSGYWKLWPFPLHWGVWCVWNLIPVIAQFTDNFPARILQLSSVDIPSGVAKQWAQWGKSPNYLWDFIPSEDNNRYQELSFPLLSIGFSDDRYLGPPKSVDKLLSYYPSTQPDLQIKTPSDYNRKSIGHFGFLKEEFHDTLWQELASWLLSDWELNESPLN